MVIHPLYKETLRKIESINPTIEVLTRVSSLIHNPNTELSDIAELMKTDASITSDMIKLSNSFMYGYATKNSNIMDALSRIGFSEANKWVNIALASGLSNKNLKHYGISAHEFWSTNVASALLMEAFTKKIGGNTNDAYSIGTLHAIGKVLIDALLDLDPPPTPWNKEQPLHLWEESLIGINHAYAGADMLKRWEFPERIYNPINDYINPPNKSLFMIQALNFSHFILRQTGYDFRNKNWEVPQKHRFMEDYGFNSEEIKEIVDEVTVVYTQTKRAMGMFD